MTHSLGGLVVKAVRFIAQLWKNIKLMDCEQAMQRCRAINDKKYQDLLKRVQAVLFCGTPHRGSSAVAWGQVLTNIAKAAFQQPNNTLLHDLEVDSQILDLIQEDFITILDEYQDINIHTFQESEGLSALTGFSGKVMKPELFLHA